MKMDKYLFNCRALYWFWGIVCFISQTLNSQGISEECDSFTSIIMNRTSESTKIGFHRDIITTISWKIATSGDIDCHILIVEDIPQEMYADLDEIKAGNYSKVVPLSQSSFDVELPAHLAAKQTLLVYPKQIEARVEQFWKINISLTTILPVHWRYQKPTHNNYYVNITLPGPTILGRCEGNTSELFQQCLEQAVEFQYPCNHNTADICQWFLLNSKFVENTMDVPFTVPVGVQQHLTLVATVTMVTTVTSSLFLVWLQP